MAKLVVTFKCPDAVDCALSECEDENVEEKFRAVINKFFRWQEYVDVEIDSETLTAKVLEK